MNREHEGLKRSNGSRRWYGQPLPTGAPPAVHGLPANVFYAPAVDAEAPISIGEGENVAQLRAAYGVFAATTMSCWPPPTSRWAR